MPSDLRLAIFTETFLPKIDGIVTVACILLDRLQERGIEAIVFAPGTHPEEYAGHRVVSVPGVRLPHLPRTDAGVARSNARARYWKHLTRPSFMS